MGLLGNYTALNANAGRGVGGFSNPYERIKVSNVMAFYCGDAIVSDITDKSAFNNGYNSHYAWVLSPKAGGMSMSMGGNSSITIELIPQYPMSADLTGSGDLVATASLLIAMLCDMIGTGTLVADINGISLMSCDFTGNGDLGASINALGNMGINLEGMGGLDAIIGAIGAMSIDMVVTGTGLTTANVGDAVWNTSIEGTYTASDVLKILSAVAAGKTTIVNLGGGLATVTFRDINDTEDTVVADMTDSERTTVTITI